MWPKLFFSVPSSMTLIQVIIHFCKSFLTVLSITSPPPLPPLKFPSLQNTLLPAAAAQINFSKTLYRL